MSETTTQEEIKPGYSDIFGNETPMPQAPVQEPKSEQVEPAKEDANKEKEPLEDKNNEQRNNNAIKADENKGEKQDDSENVADANPITDEAVLAYLKEKGVEATSLEELSKPKGVSQTKNPYEGLDETTKKYLIYHQKTGKGLDEFNATFRDIDKISEVDLITERVSKESGDNSVNSRDALAHVLEELNIDSESEINELSGTDRIKLNKYVNDYKKKLKSEQDEAEKLLEAPQDKATEKKQEYVTLDDGTIILKEKFDTLTDERKLYEQALETEVDSITSAPISLTLNEADGSKSLTFNYDYSKDDKHSMLSRPKDVLKTIQQEFTDKNGTFQHGAFAENFWWANPANRTKAFQAILSQVYSKGMEGVIGDRDNISLNRAKPDLSTPQRKEGYVTMEEAIGANHGMF